MFVLDRFYVEDSSGNFYTVVGNRHPLHSIYAYLKYRVAGSKTGWCRGSVCYERTVPTYTPENVYKSTPGRIYDAYYGSHVPAIPVSIVEKVYDPRTRLQELVRKPGDYVEEEAGYYASLISREANVPLECIGVTGSVLLGIHSVTKSDVDYVVYGTRCSEKIVEAISEGGLSFLKPFPQDKLYEWALYLSRLHGVSVVDVMASYRRWRRGVLESGREYSLSFSLDYMEPYCSEKWFTIGVARVKAFVEKTGLTLGYPARASIVKYRVLDVIKGVFREPLREVLSFENLYLPLLYEGGWVVVEGAIQWSPDKECSRILVGVVEYKGYVVPAKHSLV